MQQQQQLQRQRQMLQAWAQLSKKQGFPAAHFRKNTFGTPQKVDSREKRREEFDDRQQYTSLKICRPYQTKSG